MSQRKAGVALSYISEGIKILSSLLYTPVMLRLLGDSEYGLYQLVFSVVSYLSLLSLGFGSSYMRFYSRYKVIHDEDGIARLNGMFMVIFSLISVICLLCGGVMLTNIRAVFGSRLTEAEIGTARWLMVLMIVNLSLTFPSSVFNCQITAHEQFFFQKLLIVLNNLCSPFITLPLLLMGYGSIGMVAVTTFMTLATLVANIVFCKKKLKVRFLFRNFQLSLFKEMWVFTFFIFLNQIIDQINWSVDKYLLGRFLGTAKVAVYGVASQINTLYLQFSGTISSIFVPQVNRIVAENRKDNELSDLFIRVGRIQFMLMAMILSGFIFFGKPFIRFWAGQRYADAYAVTLFLITPLTVPLIQNLGVEIQRAKNRHKVRSVVYFFIALGNVFVSVPLIKQFGPVGAAAGTAFSLLIGNVFFMNWYYHKKIRLDIPLFWKNIVGFFPALLIPVALGIANMLFITYTNIPLLLCGIVAYAAIYCASMYFFGMNESEKEMVTGVIKTVLRRRDNGGEN